MKKNLALIAGLTCTLAFASVTGCAQGSQADTADDATTDTTEDTATNASDGASLDLSSQRLTDEDITTAETYENDADGEHALEVDGETAEYAQVSVNKTGEADGDEADFYGENAAVFATDGATLNLTDAIITTDGTHANAFFSYGDGTTSNISHSIIRTSNNCSGGLMTTGGGTTNASDVTVETSGNSSAAIRSDRGGGDVNVSGGYFTTSGTGSPVIYSTADINVDGAYLESTSSQGVVVEGKNSVALKDCQLIASNTSKNSDKSDYFQAVMIYQSMSGDASSGTSSFSMDGGSLTNNNGDVFFINNTACDISLNDASIVNNDEDGVFLRAEAAGWGNEGSNGGKANLNATSQNIDGDILVDSNSALNLYLSEKSSFEGAINPDGQEGDVYIELDANSTWTLTADSYVSSLTCTQGSINLNGHTLYIDGVEYQSDSASAGEAVEIASEDSSDSGMGAQPGEGGGQGGEAPDGNGQGGEPPADGGQGGGEKSHSDGSQDDGQDGEGGEPPAKPE